MIFKNLLKLILLTPLSLIARDTIDYEADYDHQMESRWRERQAKKKEQASLAGAVVGSALVVLFGGATAYKCYVEGRGSSDGEFDDMERRLSALQLPNVPQAPLNSTRVELEGRLSALQLPDVPRATLNNTRVELQHEPSSMQRSSSLVDQPVTSNKPIKRSKSADDLSGLEEVASGVQVLVDDAESGGPNDVQATPLEDDDLQKAVLSDFISQIIKPQKLIILLSSYKEDLESYRSQKHVVLSERAMAPDEEIEVVDDFDWAISNTAKKIEVLSNELSLKKLIERMEANDKFKSFVDFLNDFIVKELAPILDKVGPEKHSSPNEFCVIFIRIASRTLLNWGDFLAATSARIFRPRDWGLPIDIDSDNARQKEKLLVDGSSCKHLSRMYWTVSGMNEGDARVAIVRYMLTGKGKSYADAFGKPFISMLEPPEFEQCGVSIEQRLELMEMQIEEARQKGDQDEVERIVSRIQPCPVPKPLSVTVHFQDDDNQPLFEQHGISIEQRPCPVPKPDLAAPVVAMDNEIQQKKTIRRKKKRRRKRPKGRFGGLKLNLSESE